MPDSDAISRARAAIAEGEAAIVNAYWIVCDHQGRAVDPAEIDAPDGVLDEAFAAAQRIEAIARERGLSWSEARDLL